MTEAHPSPVRGGEPVSLRSRTEVEVEVEGEVEKYTYHLTKARPVRDSTATAAVLDQHVDQPDARHRCVILDSQHVRCLDCQRTILIRQTLRVGGSTSTSQIPLGLRDPAACPAHAGQRAATCGPCRAEQLEADRSRPHTPTADVAVGAAACRAALAARKTRTEASA